MMVNGYKGLNDFRHSAVFTILKILIKSGDMEGQVGTMVFNSTFNIMVCYVS